MAAKPKPEPKAEDLVPGFVTYIGPFDELEVVGLGVVRRGVAFECPAELAGYAPAPSTDEACEDYPGEGLLAQSDNYRPAVVADVTIESEA